MHFISQDNRIPALALERIKETEAFKKYAPDMEKEKKLREIGVRLASYAKTVGQYYIYKALPYPLSAFFFLHWQIGATAFAFCVIPAILALWAVYHAQGNRNYFATNPEAFKDVAVAEGPIYDDDESSESSYPSASSDYERGENQPLSRRHRDSRHTDSQSYADSRYTDSRVTDSRYTDSGYTDSAFTSQRTEVMPESTLPPRRGRPTA